MSGTVRIRPAAVAGSFYPAEASELRRLVERCVATAVPADAEVAHVPKALVVPHAGLVYSGPIAASAYLRVAHRSPAIRRVVLLGPNHRVALRGIAATSADAWATPLGLVPIDTAAVRAVVGARRAVLDDAVHAPEHSLEVQLPFLQVLLPGAALVPFVVGDVPPQEVAALLDDLWGGPETLVVISTDLSHYHRYEEARELDARTAAAIVALRPDGVGDLDACGSAPLRGLLEAAPEHGLQVELIDLRSSGDTAGDRDRVVGYGAFALA